MKALLEALRPGEKDWELARAIDSARLPKHIAIIMDGNGRWAGRASAAGGRPQGGGRSRPRYGGDLRAARHRGADALRVLARRTGSGPGEVDMLWRLLRIISGRNCRLRKTASGCAPSAGWRPCPPQARSELRDAVEITGGNRGLLVNLAINYGGRTEWRPP